MGDASVVAARHHAIVRAQRLVAPGQVRFGFAIEVAEGGRERIAAVLAGRPAEGPERVLQPVGQGHEALAAEHDLGMLEAGMGEREMIQAVVEPLAFDGDPEAARVGEVGLRLGAGRMRLAKDDLPLGPVQGLPGSDAPFEGAPVARPVALRMTALELLEQRDRAQARHRLEQRQDVADPHRAKKVRRRYFCSIGGLVRGQAWIALNAPSGPLAEAGLGSGQALRVGSSTVHVQSHLLVRDAVTGHAAVLFWS